MLNFEANMVAFIHRISETIISVEGIECIKEADGRYYPTMPELTNVSLFPAAVDCFLEIEKRKFMRQWDITVDGLLKKLNIDYEQN